MVQSTPTIMAELYLADETAWLEQSAELIRDGRVNELDYGNLAEFLTDMARRDRREVISRLVVYLAHLLKWEHQPDKRSGSWQATIMEQGRELREIVESGTLRRHALAEFDRAYTAARKQAAVETGLPRSTFPEVPAWDLDAALAEQDEA